MIRNLTLVERNERRKVQITGEIGLPVYAQGDFTDAEFHSEEHRLSTFTLKLKPSDDCLPGYCLPCPASEMFRAEVCFNGIKVTSIGRCLLQRTDPKVLYHPKCPSWPCSKLVELCFKTKLN